MNELDCVVVNGITTFVSVIVKEVPPAIGLLSVAEAEVAAVLEYVEERLRVQDREIEDISAGNVTVMMDPVIRLLTSVKVTTQYVLVANDKLPHVTPAVTIVDTVAETSTVN